MYNAAKRTWDGKRDSIEKRIKDIRDNMQPLLNEIAGWGGAVSHIIEESAVRINHAERLALRTPTGYRSGDGDLSRAENWPVPEGK